MTIVNQVFIKIQHKDFVNNVIHLANIVMVNMHKIVQNVEITQQINIYY